MTAPNLLDLEGPLTELRGAVSCLFTIGQGMENGEDADALLYLAGAMSGHIQEARAWFDAENEARQEAKATGPVAVS